MPEARWSQAAIDCRPACAGLAAHLQALKMEGARVTHGSAAPATPVRALPPQETRWHGLVSISRTGTHTCARGLLCVVTEATSAGQHGLGP